MKEEIDRQTGEFFYKKFSSNIFVCQRKLAVFLLKTIVKPLHLSQSCEVLFDVNCSLPLLTNLPITSIMFLFCRFVLTSGNNPTFVHASPNLRLS